MNNNMNNLPIATAIPVATQIGQPLTMKPMSSDNILIVNLNMNTNGGSIGQNIRYTPEMSNPQTYKEYPDILFIPTIKLEQKIFNQTIETMGQLGSFDKRNIFLSPTLFSNFIATLQNKYKYKKISLKDAKDKGIINHNIMFILTLFFGKGQILRWSGVTYTITNYNWNTGFKEDNTKGKPAPIYKVNVDVQLIKGDNPSFVDFARSGCLEKKNEIINNYFELITKKNDNDEKQSEPSESKIVGGKKKNRTTIRKKTQRNKKLSVQHKRRVTKIRSKK
tara:strand:+ start:334 stop:1167 length:834 start_codon:yes stop_codon:yes gene_type:complete